jgi:hypothetical protein
MIRYRRGVRGALLSAAFSLSACGPGTQGGARVPAEQVGDVKGYVAEAIFRRMDVSNQWTEKLSSLADVPLLIGAEATSLKELEQIQRAFEDGRTLMFIRPTAADVALVEAHLGVSQKSAFPDNEWVEVLALEKEPDGELNRLYSYLPNASHEASDKAKATRQELGAVDHVFAEDRLAGVLDWANERNTRFGDTDTKGQNFRATLKNGSEADTPYIGKINELASAYTEVHQLNFQGSLRGKQFNNKYTSTILAWSMYDAAKGENWFYVRRINVLPTDGVIDQDNERANWPLKYQIRSWLPDEQGKAQDSVFLQTSSPETTENEIEVENGTSLKVGGELSASVEPEIGVDATFSIENAETVQMKDVQVKNYSGQGWDNKTGPLIHAQAQWEYQLPEVTASRCSLSRGLADLQKSTFQPKQEWVWMVKDSYREQSDALRFSTLFQPTLGYAGAFSGWLGIQCDWYNERASQDFVFTTQLQWPRKPTKRAQPKYLNHQGKAELAEFSETVMRRWVTHTSTGGSYTGSTSVRQVVAPQAYYFYFEQRPRFTPNVIGTIKSTGDAWNGTRTHQDFGKAYRIRNFVPGAEGGSEISLVDVAKPETTQGSTSYTSKTEQSFGGGVGVGLHGLAVKVSGEVSTSKSVGISLPDITIRYLGVNNVTEWLYELKNAPRTRNPNDQNNTCGVDGPSLINYAAFEPEHVWIWRVDKKYAEAHPEGLRLHTEVKAKTGTQRSESRYSSSAVQGNVTTTATCKGSDSESETNVPVEDLVIPWLKEGKE